MSKSKYAPIQYNWEMDWDKFNELQNQGKANPKSNILSSTSEEQTPNLKEDTSNIDGQIISKKTIPEQPSNNVSDIGLEVYPTESIDLNEVVTEPIDFNKVAQSKSFSPIATLSPQTKLYENISKIEELTKKGLNRNTAKDIVLNQPKVLNQPNLNIPESDAEIRQGEEIQRGINEKLAMTWNAAKNIPKSLISGIGDMVKSTAFVPLVIKKGNREPLTSLDFQNAENSPVYKLGETIDDISKSIPTNARYDENFLSGVLPQATGSYLSFIAGGLLGKAMKIPEAIIPAVTGALAQGALGYEDAKKYTKDPEKLFQSYFVSLGIGTTEAIPIAGLFGKLNKASNGVVKNIFDKYVQRMARHEGYEEFIQEFGQQIAQDITAKAIYDSSREIDLSKSFEGGAAGFITGYFALLIGHKLQNKRISKDDREYLDKAIENIGLTKEQIDKFAIRATKPRTGIYIPEGNEPKTEPIGENNENAQRAFKREHGTAFIETKEQESKRKLEEKEARESNEYQLNKAIKQAPKSEWQPVENKPSEPKDIQQIREELLASNIPAYDIVRMNEQELRNKWRELAGTTEEDYINQQRPKEQEEEPKESKIESKKEFQAESNTSNNAIDVLTNKNNDTEKQIFAEEQAIKPEETKTPTEEAEVLKDKYKAFKNGWKKTDYSKTSDIILNKPLSSDVYLFPNDTGHLVELKYNNKLIGSFHSFFDKEEGFLNDVEVSPAFQGHGFGKILTMLSADVSNNTIGGFASDSRGLTQQQKNVYQSLLKNKILTSENKIDVDKANNEINYLINKYERNVQTTQQQKQEAQQTETIQPISEEGKPENTQTPINALTTKKSETLTEEENKTQDKKYEHVTDIVYMPLKDIVVTPEFQNRNKLNKNKLDNIKNKYKEKELDPVHIWIEPETGKKLLIAGYHRFTAAQQLGLTKIRAIIRDDLDRKGADNYGLYESNTNRSLETPLERAKLYSKMRTDRVPEAEISRKAKEAEGKNSTKILNYSYLNQNGSTYNVLSTMEDNVEGSQDISQIADMIGEAKKRYHLTDEHEEELFDWLYNEQKYSNFRNNKLKFLDYIESFTNRPDFDKSKPLNLNNRTVRGNATIEADKKIYELRNELRTIEKTRDKILNNQSVEIPKGLTAKEHLTNITQRIQEINTELAEAIKDRISAVEADKNQQGLFDEIQNELPNKTQNETQNEADNERAKEIINNRNPEELEELAKDIESKAESGSETELNEAIEKADKLINPEQANTEQQSEPKEETLKADEVINDTEKLISDKLNDYGWTVKATNNDEYDLYNALNKKVATAKVKNGRYIITDNSGTKLLSGNNGVANGAERVAREYFYAKKNEIPEKEETGSRKETIDDRIDDALKDFIKSMNINSNIDPVQLAKGMKLIGLYTEKGIYKFDAIVKDVYSKIGDKINDILESLKQAYASFRETAKDEVYDQMDKSTREFNINKIIDKKELEDVSNRPRNSERDSGENETPVQNDGGAIQSDRERSGEIRNTVQDEDIQGNKFTDNSQSSTSLYSTPIGEQSDFDLFAENQPATFTEDFARDIDGRGSSIFGEEGFTDDESSTDEENDAYFKAVSEDFRKKQIKGKVKQTQAENIKVIDGDLDNIKETLPYLLPEQQEDVLTAEKRFYSEENQTEEKAYGKGMLFTNGTGTGKTYVGLGIIKRFVKKGKSNILIVTPSQTKVNDWMEDGKNLSLNIKPLNSTNDKGQNVVITTYANFRANQEILKRDFDLIVYDESHRIMEDKNGKRSSTTEAHFLNGNASEGIALERLKINHPLWIKAKEIFNKIREEGKYRKSSDLPQHLYLESLEKEKALDNEYTEIEKQQEKVLPDLKSRAEKAHKNTKVVFLSATPFKSHFSLRYANKFLFDWGSETTYQQASRVMSRVDAESRFMLDNFGSAYEWKYHQLQTKPLANPDAISMQEIAFSERLKKEGVLSGRQLTTEFDYSREFPKVAGFNNGLFNQAFSDIFNYEKNEYKFLRNDATEIFKDYNYSAQLFESLKASLVIPRIKKHLELGRKVVVFHRRQQGNSVPPFSDILNRGTTKANEILKYGGSTRANKILKSKDTSPEDIETAKLWLVQTTKSEEEAKLWLEQIKKFKEVYADLLQYEKTLDYRPAIEQFAEAFGDKIKFVNGNVSKNDKINAIKEFNDGNADIIMGQEEAMKEGVSLHDTKGEKPRVLISLSMPISSTTALQTEGRILRIGQASNAIFEYPVLGLDLEIAHYGNNLNKKISTTENLAIGEQSRDLARSYSEGILFNSTESDPNTKQGTGGKEYDKRAQTETNDFEKAKLIYDTNQKIRGNRNQREGVDYYPTPEPVGMKMVEFLNLQEGETMLEPSAGHGSIAMWTPDNVGLTAIEPSFELYSKLTARATGASKRILNQTFEGLDIHNKYNGIAMNPPFGQGGATAIKHIQKAFTHLKKNGRIVALVPQGNFNTKLNNWLESEEAEDAKVIAKINMPSILFNQAGTNVNTQIIVIDKISNEETRNSIKQEETDLSGIDKINKLFNEIENLTIPDRVKTKTIFDITNERANNVNENNVNENNTNDSNSLYSIVKSKHTKLNTDLTTVKLNYRISKDDYYKILNKAKSLGGFYSSYNRDGAIPGFIFNQSDQSEKATELAKFIDETQGTGNEQITNEETPLSQDLIERTELQKLQDMQRHLTYVIEEAQKRNNKEIELKATEELKTVNEKLQNFHKKETRENEPTLFDQSEQISLFQKDDKSNKTFNDMNSDEQEQFLTVISNAFLEENPNIKFEDLTKENAKGLSYIIRNAMKIDPNAADITTAMHEATHIALANLVNPAKAKLILRRNGWDGKGDYRNVKGNDSLLKAYEKIAKASETWVLGKTPTTLTDKFISGLKNLYNKLAKFLYKHGYTTQAGFFESLYSGELKKFAKNEKNNYDEMGETEKPLFAELDKLGISEKEFYNKAKEKAEDFLVNSNFALNDTAKRWYNEILTAPVYFFDKHPELKPVWRAIERNFVRKTNEDSATLTEDYWKKGLPIRELSNAEMLSMAEAFKKYEEMQYSHYLYEGKPLDDISWEEFTENNKFSPKVKKFILETLKPTMDKSIDMLKELDRHILGNTTKSPITLEELKYIDKNLYNTLKTIKTKAAQNNKLNELWQSNEELKEKIIDNLLKNKYDNFIGKVYFPTSRFNNKFYLSASKEASEEAEIYGDQQHPETFLKTSDSYAELIRIKKTLESQGFKTKIGRWDTKQKALGENDINESGLMDLIILSGLDNTTAEAQKLINAVKGKGFSKHFIQKKWTPGFDYSRKNFETAIYKYLTGVSNYKNAEIGRQELGTAISDLEENGVLTPDSPEKQYIDRLSGAVDSYNADFGKALKAAASLWALNFRSSYLIQQTVQPFNTLLPELPRLEKELGLSKGSGEIAFAKAIGDAHYFYTLKFIDKLNRLLTKKDISNYLPAKELEFYNLLKRFEKQHVAKPLRSLEYLGESVNPREKYNKSMPTKALTKLAKLIGLPGLTIEDFTRLIGIRSAYLMGKQANLNDEALENMIADTIAKTSGAASGLLSKPPIYKINGEGYGAKIANTISNLYTTFKNFGFMNYGQWGAVIRSISNDKLIRPFLYKSGGLLLFSGLKTLPFLSTLFALIDWIQDLRDKPENANLKLKQSLKIISLENKDLADILEKGIVTHSSGIDVSELFSQHAPFITEDIAFQGDNLLSPASYGKALLGAPGQLAGKTLRQLDEPNINMLPSTISNISKADKMKKEGINWGYKNILKPNQISDYDVAAKKLSFTTNKISEAYEKEKTREFAASQFSDIINDRIDDKLLNIIKSRKNNTARIEFLNMMRQARKEGGMTDKQKEEYSHRYALPKFVKTYVLSRIRDDETKKIVKDWAQNYL